MSHILVSFLLIMVWGVILIGAPYCLLRRAKNRSERGCVIGGCFVPILFLILVGISKDSPDFGGAFFLPFAIAGGGLVGWIIGKIVEKRDL